MVLSVALCWGTASRWLRTSVKASFFGLSTRSRAWVGCRSSGPSRCSAGSCPRTRGAVPGIEEQLLSPFGDNADDQMSCPACRATASLPPSYLLAPSLAVHSERDHRALVPQSGRGTRPRSVTVPVRVRPRAPRPPAPGDRARHQLAWPNWQRHATQTRDGPGSNPGAGTVLVELLRPQRRSHTGATACTVAPARH